jgi:hypothetical protein
MAVAFVEEKEKKMPSEVSDEVEVVGEDNSSREYEGKTAWSIGAGDSGWVSWLASHEIALAAPVQLARGHDGGIEQ